MKLQTYEIANMLLLNPGKLSRFSKETLSNLMKGEYKSLFTELGFDKIKDIRSQTPNPLPDRKELDDIIFDEL